MTDIDKEILALDLKNLTKDQEKWLHHLKNQAMVERAREFMLKIRMEM